MVESTTGVEHTGAMIALLPNDETCDLMHVEGGECPDELHLTLYYLGDATDHDEKTPQELANAIESMIERRMLGSIHARTFGVNHWNTDGDEPSIVLAVGDVDEGDDLAVAREMISEAWHDGMVMLDLPEQHTPWVPHIALAFSDDVELTAQLADRVGHDVVFDHVRVAFGGKNWDIPFTDAVTAAFNPGEHPRDHEGKFVEKGGGIVGKAKKAFAPTKAIYGKPSDGEVVAQHEGGTARLKWNASEKKFADQIKGPNGWETIGLLNKTTAYKLVKSQGWGAPGEAKEPTPSDKPAPPFAPLPPKPKPKPKPSVTSKVPEKFAPTKIAYGKHENGAVVAELVDKDDGAVFGRMVWNGDVKKFATQVKQPDDTWKNVAFLSKGDAYKRLKTVTPNAAWELPKSGPSTGPKIVTTTPEVPPQKFKKVPLSPSDVNSLSSALNDKPPVGLSVTGAVFDNAFVLAMKHNASIADVLTQYDDIKGYETSKTELGPHSMLVYSFLQTKAGAAFADQYVNDFGQKGSILDFGPGVKKQAIAPDTFKAPKLTKPGDAEVGVRAPNGRQHAEMVATQQNTPPPWTTDEIVAIETYTSSGYFEMNECLRQGGCDDPADPTNRYISDLKKAMRPLGVDTTSYRGVNYDGFGLTPGDFEGLQALEGQVIADKGFVSTSIDVSKKFTRLVSMTIHTPKGAPAAYVDHVSVAQGERELILNPGTKFKVLKVSLPRPPQFTKVHVEVEVVP